jgi:hypothetical protein
VIFALLMALVPMRALAAFGLGKCEDFESGLGSWSIAASGAASAGIGTQTANSGTHSLYTRSGMVTVTSSAVDLSNAITAQVSLWLRRGSNAFSDRPDNGEDMVIQWRTTATGWTDFETFPGQGQPGAIFTRTYTLPAAALASGFQIRFNQLDGDPNEDYWHVDDVCLGSSSHWGLEETSWTGAAGEVIDDTNGQNGTVFGGATTANSNPSPAINGDPGTCRYGNFDGVDDYVEIPDSPSLDLPTSLTVAAWVRVRSTPPELYTIASKDTNYEFHIDNGRHVYWWWNDSGGAAHSITTATTIALNTWVHIAVTYQAGSQVIYIDGVSRGTSSRNEQLMTNNLPFYIGTDWNFISRAFDGQIDEVYVIPRALSAAEVVALRNRTHVCPNAAVKFTINHSGFGINCKPETVTVNVIDAVAGTPRNDYNAQVQLDTQSGFGTWAKTSGSGTFNDATPNDGVATYDWPLGESQAVFTLYYPQGPPSIDVDVFQVSNTAIRDTDVEGPLVFSPNGFTVTAAPLANPPGAFATFAANETAGSNFPLYIAAYGQTPSDPVCGIIEAYNGTKSLKLWSQYANPATGTRNVTIDGVSIATSEPASAAQNVVFTNGQAVVTAKYKDVGQISVLLEDKTTTDPTDLPNGIQGGTASFVVKPYDFVLSAIQTSGGVPNPGATSSSGPIFAHAGDAFRATVTVRDAEGTATPNYGHETPAENVRLIPTLVDPAGGQLPAVAPTAGFGAFVNGVATGTSFAWSEVGIIQLRGAVADSSYLGAGDVIGVTVTGNVGRFTPHHFATSTNLPLFATACTAGGFSYEGQALNYTTAPVITATAVAAGGQPTLNYTTASYFKISNASLTNKSYTSTSPGANLSAGGVPSPDPVIAWTANTGVATLTFRDGVSFVKGALQAAFAAGVQLSINVIDADGVAAAANPVVFNSMPFSAGDQIYYGRIRIANALGSELVDLPVKMVAEYYLSAAAGFVTNAADTCTNAVSLAFSGYTKNLSPGEICVRDSGAPGASGAGCAAAAPVGVRFTEPPSAINPGDFNLRLAAPGAGNTGSVLVNGNVPAWLRYDWDTGTPGDENPTGQATFGIFGGQSKQIYTREIY